MCNCKKYHFFWILQERDIMLELILSTDIGLTGADQSANYVNLVEEIYLTLKSHSLVCLFNLIQQQGGNK